MAKNTSSSLTSKQLVESVIDSVLSGQLAPKDALGSLLEAKGTESTEPDTVSFGENEAIVCPGCGSEDFEEGFVESEDGSEVNALQCTGCGLGLVESDSQEEKLIEADIDEDDPKCPMCESSDLTSEMVECEGEEDQMLITCGGCNAQMVVAD